MTPNEALTSAIFTLQYVAEPEDADRALTLAAIRGVDTATCEALRAEWTALYRRSVQTIGGAAMTDIPRCLCGHIRSNHSAGKGQCWSTACGCGSFRAPERRIPARFDERYDPSPEPIDRRIQ